MADTLSERPGTPVITTDSVRHYLEGEIHAHLALAAAHVAAPRTWAFHEGAARALHDALTYFALWERAPLPAVLADPTGGVRHAK